MLCQWLRNGVPLRWKGDAPRQAEGQIRSQESESVMKEMEQLIIDGAFTQPEEGEEVIVSPVFTIPKKTGGVRLIHDLRKINEHLEAPHFSLQGCRDAAMVVRDSQWLCALDLKRGYQQVYMSRESRRYLGAQVGDKVVVSRVLPFGLSLSPYIFTRLTNWVAGVIRKKTGLKVAIYIDDFLLGSQTKEEMERGLVVVQELFQELGVTLSEKKQISIEREVEFLGFLWSSEKKTIRLTKERRREYIRAVKNLLRTSQPVKRWRTVIGKLIFLREAIGPTLRHVRSIMRFIRGKGNGVKVKAEGEVKEDLIWWREILQRSNEMSLIYKEVSASITTDASDVAVAYILELEGIKIQDSIPVQEKDKHINVRELEGLLECLKAHGDLLRGKHVIWYCDNISARAAIRKQGLQQGGDTMWKTTKEVLDIMDREDIKIKAKYVPGLLNRTADALSRPLQKEEEWETALRKITDNGAHWNWILVG